MVSERDSAKRDLRARVDRFLAGGNADAVDAPEATATVFRLSQDTPADSGDYLDVVQLLGWFYLCRNRILAPRAALPDLRTTTRLLAPIYDTAPQTLPILLLLTVELVAGLPPYRVPEELTGRALNLMDEGDPASLAEAAKLFVDAAAAAPIDHPDRVAMLSNACSALLDMYRLGGPPSIIEDAVRRGEDAVAALTPSTTHRAEPLTNLGIALRLRFDDTGNAGDLDRAITLLTSAAEHTPREHAEWAIRMNNLGIALGIRYERSHRPVDLDRALIALRQAGEAIRPHQPERTRFLGDLAYFHWVRFQRAGDRADLDAAAHFFGIVAASRDKQLQQSALAHLEQIEQERAKQTDGGRGRPWWRRS